MANRMRAAGERNRSRLQAWCRRRGSLQQPAGEVVRDLVVNRQASLFPGVVVREFVERDEAVATVVLEAWGDLQLVGCVDGVFGSNSPLGSIVVSVCAGSPNTRQAKRARPTPAVAIRRTELFSRQCHNHR